MLINVLDQNLKTVAIIDNKAPKAASYFKDEFIEYLNQGASSFDFTVSKFKDGVLQDYAQFLNRKTCFSFERNGKQYCVFPAGSDGFYENDTIATYKCLSLDRELSLEYVNKLDNTASHNIEWYINQMGLIRNSQIIIGRNDVSNLTRVINYDGQDTKLNRLISVIGNFDAEFEFITELESDGSVKQITLNIVKENDGENEPGIGRIREDVVLKYGKNIKGVERSYDYSYFNASTVTGKDGLSWLKSSFSYKDADGVEIYYKRAGSTTAYAPLSAQDYPAHLRADSSDIWIRKDFETEYTNVNDMWRYIVSQFKANALPKVTYTVKASSKLLGSAVGEGDSLQIGDTLTIEDDNFISEYGEYGLILSARVTQLKSSDDNPENNEVTFANFKELKSEVSDDLTARMNELIAQNTPYKADITTSNGTQFKNGNGSTVLTAHIYFGSSATETIADSYQWFKDGTALIEAQGITVNASDVGDKAVYSYQATVGGKTVGTSSVTITNVNDGIAGKDGVGILTTTITYSVSTSGTKAPTSGWSATVPTVEAGSYLWTKTVWAYTDNTSETSYSVARQGQDGATGPSGPKGDDGAQGTAGTDAVNIDLSNKSYNFLANLQVSDSGSAMQAVAGSTTTTFTALQGTTAINITGLSCTTTLPTGMTVSIGALNALSVVVTISVDNTMTTANGVLNFSVTAGGVTTVKSFSYSLAINDLNVNNLGAITADIGTISNNFNYIKNGINYVGHLMISGGEYSITYAIERGDKASRLIDYEYKFNITLGSKTVPPMTGWVSEALTFEPNWYGIFLTYDNGVQTASYFPNLNGAQFTGNETVTYQIGTSGTTIPTGTWLSTAPTVSLTQFLWLKINFPTNPSAIAYACYYGGIATSGGTISMSPYEGVATVRYDELERWKDVLYKQDSSISQISNDGLIGLSSSSSSGTNSISFATNPLGAQMAISSLNSSNFFNQLTATPTGVKLSTDVPWTSLGSYLSYKREGNTVTLRVNGAVIAAGGNITLGNIPAKDCPAVNVMGIAIAWALANTNDRHLQINASGGTVTILNAVANQNYTFQFKYDV